MNHAIKVLRHYHSALGVSGVAAFLLARLTKRQPEFKTWVAGIRHPVYVRIGTTDATVLKQVLLEKHYNVPLPGALKLIVDAGANIGLSAVYFANRYPNAKIIAIEPESSNFEMLQRNTAAYPQITPVQAALWKVKEKICLVDPNYGHHGFQTVEAKADQSDATSLVQAITIEDVLAMAGTPAIDLLKVDIEGAEKDVFENSGSWMDKVGAVMAELHETIKPGSTDAFNRATESFGETRHLGETIIRLRKTAMS
jgi:FkbM family methyltransferase